MGFVWDSYLINNRRYFLRFELSNFKTNNGYQVNWLIFRDFFENKSLIFLAICNFFWEFLKKRNQTFSIFFFYIFKIVCFIYLLENQNISPINTFVNIPALMGKRSVFLSRRACIQKCLSWVYLENWWISIARVRISLTLSKWLS